MMNKIMKNFLNLYNYFFKIAFIYFIGILYSINNIYKKGI